MDAFLIGLQFLTRIHVVKQTVWTEEAFSKSVRYFPLVGLVLGAVYALLAVLTELPAQYGYPIPVHLRVAFLAIVPILLTGGIHIDGLMDTADGIFSGREREKMLAIMKDSRSGSFGVAAFGIFLLLQYSALLDMPREALPFALLAMPVIGRLMMVVAISLFPSARPDGLGRAFGKYADRKSCFGIGAYTAVILALVSGWQGLCAMAAAFAFTYLFGRYVTGLLGGLTGDVYGAICTLSELLTLVVFLLV